MDASSSEMPRDLERVECRDHQEFGERAFAVDADADRVAAQMPATGTAVAAEAARDVPLARDAIADREAADFLAHLDDLATYSWPTCMGTGMVFCAQSSHFQMWMSVPQIAVFRIRIMTSLWPPRAS